MKPDNPKAGNPKNVNGGKVVGQSGSTTYVETDNETKKDPDVRSPPKNIPTLNTPMTKSRVTSPQSNGDGGKPNKDPNT
eukprot:6111383-Ditylum_brightwellii.AAC.1